MYKVQGVALVQVLVIALILSIMSLFVLQSVRHQVGVSQSAVNKFKLKLVLETAEAELIEALVMYRPYRDTNSSVDIIRNWRFDNTPFKLRENIHAQIQDMRSLVNLNYTDATLASNTLNRLGIDQKQVEVVIASLEDWKDKDALVRPSGAENDYYQSAGLSGPRNSYLQSVFEFLKVRGAKDLNHIDVKNYFTVANQIGFNPMNAPELILNALLNDTDKVKTIIRERDAGTLTDYKFREITGLEANEFLIFATGSYLRVQLEVVDNEATLKKSFIVRVKPAARVTPIIISEVKWN
ncbi:general secretion pathway protein GspK [Pseudoalteromonas sp. McH1-7]|uniref:general secretion pathway protein GspK n=1 Tax=unclassified Pseudoalteromonas TaxID=194690 RepID=UPI001590A388|nr:MULTISPECIES: type II secretion system protein GspK [unclassified Pseudoalteromonas]NUZ10693.1 general secretion pathway protein GspK [Pseudoalteromonas sp. McH1-7]USD29058.1 general secretion pathway protein GspK [Pseudoalteromonas sp. SCSIO 43201]